jgi:hypothetical protein
MNHRAWIQTAAGSMLLAAAVLGGCGIANTIRSVSWEAELDTAPDAACVRDAIAATAGVTLAEYKHEEKPHLFAYQTPDQFDRYFVKVAALPFATSSDMGLQITRLYKHRPRFALHYGYSQQYDQAETATAKAVISAISGRCGAPELEQRARRTTSEDWVPYLFNV